MLSQQFAFERVALLTGHLRDVERIIHLGDILNRLLRPTMNRGDPGVRGPVRAVRIIQPDPSEVGSDNFVRVLLERQTAALEG